MGGPQIEVNGCLKAGWEAMAAGDVCSDINLADPTPDPTHISLLNINLKWMPQTITVWFYQHERERLH